MEVHHHAHTPRKKWTHYLWEFLMLFLAVFCGFLAENSREHMVEHQREKKYMRMLAEDLTEDTLAMHKAIDKGGVIVQSGDTVLQFLRSFNPRDVVSYAFADLIGRSGMRQSLVTSDRTSAQLKNSGSLRLVRNEKVATMILKYWNQIDETNQQLDRYMVYRNASRELVFKLWVLPDVYVAGTDEKEASVKEMRIIDTDPKKWDEMTNLISMGRSITRVNIITDLNKQLDLARQLIFLLKQEYHLR